MGAQSLYATKDYIRHSVVTFSFNERLSIESTSNSSDLRGLELVIDVSRVGVSAQRTTCTLRDVPIVLT